MPDPITPTGSPGMGQLAPQIPGFSAALGQGASPVPSQNANPGSSGEARAQALQQVAAGQSAGTWEIQGPEKGKGKGEDRAPSLEDAAKSFKEYLANLPSDLQFQKDEETGTVIFRVVNPLTKEVIREFPPKEIVEMSKRLRHLSEQAEKSGILLDTET